MSCCATRLALLLSLAGLPTCHRATPGPGPAADRGPGAGQRVPAAMRDGRAADRAWSPADARLPPRVERPAALQRAEQESQQLARSLLQGGIARREVTSIADIRGFRLVRQRRYREARVWLELGVRIDPSFEPCVYNAARVAALLGDLTVARAHLQRLRRAGTPLATRYLGEAAADADFAALR